MSEALHLIIKSEEFFATPLKKLAVEENRGAGRTYFLKGERIVAVAIPAQESSCRTR
jgi:hypothetical protein